MANTTETNILNTVNAYKSSYPDAKEGFREDLIEMIVRANGEDYRQFAVDTTYRELRNPDEPEYQPPEIKKDEAIEETEDYSDNKWYGSLTGETKSLFAQYMYLMENGTVEEQKAWTEALTIAGEKSDAYFGEQLNIFKDEFEDALGTSKANLEDKEKELAIRTRILEENLENQKEDLSVEQSAELARRKEDYKVTLKNTRNTLASRGLSSSSIRHQAEERLNTSQTDVIESTERRYARSLRNAELTKSRGMEAIGFERDIAERKREEEKTAYAKGAEQLWGSEKVKEFGILGGFNLSDYMFGGVSQGSKQVEQVFDEKSWVNTVLQGAGY